MLQNDEENLLDEGKSPSHYGPLIPILLSSDARRQITSDEWPTWRSRAVMGSAADESIKALSAEILQKCPAKAETISLRQVLSDPTSENLSRHHIQGAPTHLVALCTVWAAYKNKYPSKTFKCYISNLGRVAEDTKQRLAVPERRGDGNLPADWAIWKLMVALRGDLDRKVGEIALEIKDNWPSNRLGETLKDYLVDDYNELLTRRSFGRKKLRTVIRCFAFAGVFGRTQPTDTSTSPFAILKSLNLPRNYTKCIRLRYGKAKLQTLDAVGRETGLTRERVRQMEQKAARIAKSAGKHLEARKWLAENRLRAWKAMSKDGGLTVDPTISGAGFHANMPGEIQLGLLLADMLPDELMDQVGDRIDDWWAIRETSPPA